MKDLRLWLAQNYGALLALALFVLMFAIYIANHSAGLTVPVVTTAANKGVLLALVGGLGLTGAMSINVLERTREIGVMRAVGASDSAILKIVLVEGITVGLISWLFGSLLAYPIGKFLSDTVGRELLEAPLNYRFASDWAIIWLFLIICIALFASFLPAWNASRLTVREVLAYE